MYRDMEMTFWLPETEAALAEVEAVIRSLETANRPGMRGRDRGS
jgi:hypothetical protein